MLQILESILGNKATEWLNQHNAGPWALGAVIVLVAAGWLWKWREKRGAPATGPTATARAIGNVINQHFHFGSTPSDGPPVAPRTSVFPPEAEAYFREQRLRQPQRVEHVHPVVMEPPAAVGVTSTGGDWEQAYKDELIAHSLPLKIELKWKPNIGAGCTPGMWFQATNRDSATVEGASVFITDIKRWDDSIGDGAFVTTPDIHGVGTTFTEVQIGTATLHPSIAESVGFLHYEMGRLDIQGQRQEHIRMTLPGTRRITYRIEEKDSRKTTGTICFEWKGSERASRVPTPCECPRRRPSADSAQNA